MAQIYGIQDLKKDFSQLRDTDDTTRIFFFMSSYNAWNYKRDRTITEWGYSGLGDHSNDCIFRGRSVRVTPNKVNMDVHTLLFDRISCERIQRPDSSLEMAVINHFKQSTKVRFDKLLMDARRDFKEALHATEYGGNCRPYKVLLPDAVWVVGEKALTFYFGPKRAMDILKRADKLKTKGCRAE